MKKILVRSGVGALVLVQVVLILLIVDQKKTAKAQVPPGCILANSGGGEVACGGSFFTGSDCVDGVTVTCSGGKLTAINFRPAPGYHCGPIGT